MHVAIVGSATLEARNQLTLFLHNHCQERYRLWNEMTAKFKEDVITSVAKSAWEPFQRSHGLDIAFLHCVRWDILSALMENAYIACGHQSFFFLELLTVYETGHFPCGWIGTWPRGKLVVY